MLAKTSGYPLNAPVLPADLPQQVNLVVRGLGSHWPVTLGRRTLVEVTSVAQAHSAVRDGAHGLIAKGAEAGSWIGPTTTFILLQQLLAVDFLATRVAELGIAPNDSDQPAKGRSEPWLRSVKSVVESGGSQAGVSPGDHTSVTTIEQGGDVMWRSGRAE